MRILSAAALAAALFTALPALAATKAAPAAATPAAGQYATETDAKAQCGSDMVVWANKSSKVYHYAGTRTYGKGKKGTYMCQADSDKQGFRAAKNEKAPAKKS